MVNYLGLGERLEKHARGELRAKVTLFFAVVVIVGFFSFFFYCKMKLCLTAVQVILNGAKAGQNYENDEKCPEKQGEN